MTGGVIKKMTKLYLYGLYMQCAIHLNQAEDII